jgi:tetratricopeptide (TPR) repeat protein
MAAMFHLTLVLGCLCAIPATADAHDEAPSQVQASAATYLKTLEQAREATKARQWPQAAELWARVVEANPTAGSFWSRLGEARYETKQYRPAISAYERALELRYGYPWGVAYNIACCCALLGEKEEALRWLEKSFAMGYREVARARGDQDLVSLREDRRFRDLVGLVDVSKMTRDEGWRYDLAWLAREISRMHYSPFKKVSREEFEGLVRKLHEDIPHLSDTQIAVAFMKLSALPGDGHTLIRPAYARRETRKAAPVRFFLFSEGLYVIAADPAHGDLAGAQVLRIGEHSVEETLNAMEPVISRDNSMWPKLVGPDLMPNAQILNGLGLIPSPDKLPLTIRDRTGKERAVELPVDSGEPKDSWVTARQGASGPAPLYLKNPRASYWFEYLPEAKTVYFQYSAVQNDPKESLEKFCTRLFKFINEKDVDRLVIDMRMNGGGNNFLNRPLVHGLMRCDKINRKGKLFVIIGRRTFSAAMNGATDIERETEAIFVGEPTGSCPNFVGESVPLALRYSKMRGSISDLYWQRSVAMDYRTWIPPTIYTPPTFEDYCNNRDPALEAVLAYRD